MAAAHIHQRGLRALVGHVLELHAALLGQQQRGQVAGCAHGGNGRRPRALCACGKHLAQLAVGQLRGDHQHQRRLAHARHGDKVGLRVIGRMGQYLLGQHMRGGREQQGVAIGGGRQHRAAPHHAAAAHAVLDDDRRAQLLAQLLGKQPRGAVHAAARHEGHDDLDHLARLGKGRGRAGRGHAGEGPGRQRAQECAQHLPLQPCRCFHALSPVSF